MPISSYSTAVRYNRCAHQHLHLLHCHQARGVAFLISITVLMFIFHLILSSSLSSYSCVSRYPGDLSCLIHHLQGDTSPLRSTLKMRCFDATAPLLSQPGKRPADKARVYLGISSSHVNHLHNICDGHGCAAAAACVGRYLSPQTANLSQRKALPRRGSTKETTVPSLHLDTMWNMSRNGRAVLTHLGTTTNLKQNACWKCSRASVRENKRARGSVTADIFTNQQAR